MIFLKINLQKLISLIIVVTIVIMVLNISAFATSEPSAMTSQEYKVAQSYLIERYCNGEITFTQWQEQQAAVNTQFLESNKNVSDAAYALAVTTSNQFSGIASKISFAFEQWGDGARERVAEWWNRATQNVPTEETKTPTTDLGGSGAMVYTYYDGSHIQKLPCDYIVVKCNANGEFVSYKYCTNDGRIVFAQNKNSDGKWISYAGFSTPSDFISLASNSHYTYKFYGDVRYEDGTSAPTDYEFEYGTIKKFDEMPDKDLEDLLDDFAEEAERQNPDLSSIEGLLKAIYARMGKLDSDNDNQLLSEVLAAIKALKSTDTDNTELLELLEDIKNSLVFENGENKETFSEQLKKIIDNQITRDDFVIDEDLYNNHGEILKNRLLGKFSFIYNIKKIVTYCFDVYSNTSENPKFNIEYDGKSYSVDFNVFNDYLTTIQLILAASVYLTYAYHTYRKIPSYINGGDNE